MKNFKLKKKSKNKTIFSFCYRKRAETSDDDEANNADNDKLEQATKTLM